MSLRVKSLKDKMTQVEVVEEFESRPYKAVQAAQSSVFRGRERQRGARMEGTEDA